MKTNEEKIVSHTKTNLYNLLSIINSLVNTSYVSWLFIYQEAMMEDWLSQLAT